LLDITETDVKFIRVDPDDLSSSLAKILEILNDKSWISRFPLNLQQAFEIRATQTIEKITKSFEDSSDDSITKDAGEYVVSELAREAIITDTNYLEIPLAELIGKQVSGNPGFDFYSKNNNTHTVIFGEAKYNSRQSAYASDVNHLETLVCLAQK
jgi:hypothetical protein